MCQHLPLSSRVEQELEAEEVSSVPSAVSEPRWDLHMCDNKCRAKRLKFFEIAASVSEGGAAHTKCHNERRLKQGE